jgi:hypothetical protein
MLSTGVDQFILVIRRLNARIRSNTWSAEINMHSNCFLHHLTTLFQLHRSYSIECDGEMIMNNEYARAQKKDVVAYLTAFACRH